MITDKLLLKYIDKPLTLERNAATSRSSTSGTLLSSIDGLVLRGDDGMITALRDYSALRFQELPGASSRCRRCCDIKLAPGGTHKARVTYQTGGITWWAVTNLLFTPARTRTNGFVDLAAGSASSTSRGYLSGCAIEADCREVNRAPQPSTARHDDGDGSARRERWGFEEKPSTNHLYTLGRRTTLPNNSTKQVELFDRRARCRRIGFWCCPTTWVTSAAGYEIRTSPPPARKVDAYLNSATTRPPGSACLCPPGVFVCRDWMPPIARSNSSARCHANAAR